MHLIMGSENFNLSNTRLTKLVLDTNGIFNKQLILPNTIKVLMLNDNFENGNESKLNLSHLINYMDLNFEQDQSLISH